MVVDAKVNPAQQMLKGNGQHTGRGHINGDNGISLLCIFLGQTLIEPAEMVCDLRIAQHMGGFAHLAQTQTQGCRRAQSIAVGTAVGQDAEIVMIQQIFCALIPGQILHRASLPRS